jgi:hypothetical protein
MATNTADLHRPKLGRTFLLDYFRYARNNASLSPVNIIDREISDFLCGLHRLWIVCKASLEALEELLHHLCGYAISYGLMRAEAVVV